MDEEVHTLVYLYAITYPGPEPMLIQFMQAQFVLKFPKYIRRIYACLINPR